jgi:hypothetical protein
MGLKFGQASRRFCSALSGQRIANKAERGRLKLQEAAVTAAAAPMLEREVVVSRLIRGVRSDR